eukprot:COSAG01_NODE_2375_length_7802_cov_60.079579_3_plen_65_part_00
MLPDSQRCVRRTATQGEPLDMIKSVCQNLVRSQNSLHICVRGVWTEPDHATYFSGEPTTCDDYE